MKVLCHVQLSSLSQVTRSWHQHAQRSALYRNLMCCRAFPGEAAVQVCFAGIWNNVPNLHNSGPERYLLPGAQASLQTLHAFLQLEAALVKAQKLVKQNEEQQSSLQQKLQSSMAGRQDTVRLSTACTACAQHLVLSLHRSLYFSSGATHSAIGVA